jgi:MFS family permease
VDTIGRKPLLIGSMLSACVFSVAFAFVSEDGSGGGGGGGKVFVIITAAMCFNAAATAAWNAINCLSTEHFATSIRGTTLGLLAACGRLGSISAQFVNGSLQSNIPLLLVVTSGMMLLGALAGVFLPKQSSKQLLD